MHIPDGLMDPIVIALGWIISVVVLWIVLRIMKNRVEERHIPLMAILAAGIFVAQMINFPIGAGASGHLVGAALAAVLLGPYSALVVITSILLIQSLLFGDGGLTALGLNILNMGIVGCFAGWYVFRLFPERYRMAGILIASWSSVFLGSLACALQLSLSHSLSGGTFGIPAQVAIPTMMGFHAIIGIGEAIITSGIFIYLSQTSPEILRIPKIMARPQREVS